MPRIFLHIGDYKTGSTAIQQTLGRNRPALAAGGLIYPGSEDDHRAVAYALRDMPGGAAAPSIRDEAFAAKGVILSSEGFASVDPERMRAWCGDADVTVIVYLREQAEAMASQYQQQVKAGLMSEGFEAFAEGLVYDYAGLLGSWAAAFGQENILAHAYPDDAVAHFLALLGIDGRGWRSLPHDPNPSIAGALLEAKRRLNAGFSGSAEDMMHLTWASLIEMARANQRFRGRVAASDALLADIRDRHRETNAALAERFGVVFQERPWIAPAFEETDVRGALAELMRRRPALAELVAA